MRSRSRSSGPLRIAATVVCAGLLACGAAANAQMAVDPGAPVVPLGLSQKLKVHAARVVGPFPLLVSGMQAGVLQGLDIPDEWGQGSRGLGRRYAAVTGSNAVRNMFAFALKASLKQDPRYFRSDQTAKTARTRHALLTVFRGRTDRGRSTIAVWRLGSAFGAAFLADAWQPPSRAGPGHALLRGSVTLAADAGWCVFAEFWPDIKRKLGRN
jgi:hypothetical protein